METKKNKSDIEVIAVSVGYGQMRRYVFNCPHCSRSIVVGHGGTEQGCNHGYRLTVRSFDDVIAVYKSIPTLEPAKA